MWSRRRTEEYVVIGIVMLPVYVGLALYVLFTKGC